jgi:hypothetical protein
MKLFLLILFVLASNLVSAQDSVVVSQRESIMFSNKYVFYKNGIFKHYFHTDDLQLWYGKGTYKDKGKTRYLNFGGKDLSFERAGGFSTKHEVNFTRKLKKRNEYFLSKDYYNTTNKRIVIFEPDKT